MAMAVTPYLKPPSFQEVIPHLPKCSLLLHFLHSLRFLCFQYSQQFPLSQTIHIPQGPPGLLLPVDHLPQEKEEILNQLLTMGYTPRTCSEYLTENEPTPYALVRETMHIFSQAVQNRCRPQSVTWVNENEVIIDGKKINLTVFRDFLHFQIQSLENFFKEKVLFGFDLEKLGIAIDFCKLGDHGDFTTIRYNPLLLSLGGNPDSEIFLEALVKKGEVVSFKSGKFVWEMEQAQLWVADINQAVQVTYAIAHIRAPGRTTEEDKMQIANTLLTRRHLIVPQISTHWLSGQTIGKGQIFQGFLRRSCEYSPEWLLISFLSS